MGDSNLVHGASKLEAEGVVARAAEALAQDVRSVLLALQDRHGRVAVGGPDEVLVILPLRPGR